MCFVCRAQQAGLKNGEVLSVRITTATRKKLQALKESCGKGSAAIIEEAIEVYGKTLHCV